MNNMQLHIMAIACVTSLACVLPGIFLVLRGVALMCDAISHSILLGIVIMFLWVGDLHSPLLIVGAIISGMAMVTCAELLIQTRLLKKDAAIGLIFPLFFSIGVILISRYASHVHLDLDMVLLGELAFAPFVRLIVFGYDLGPWALWTMSFVLILNSLFIVLLYKELKIVTFDAEFARVAQFSPTFLHYGLMLLTSITAVGAFEVVGSIVMVAMAIAPAATAYLLADTVFDMIIISLIIAVIGSIVGYLGAYWIDISIAGSIATVLGILFLIVLMGKVLLKKKAF